MADRAHEGCMRNICNMVRREEFMSRWQENGVGLLYI